MNSIARIKQRLRKEMRADASPMGPEVLLFLPPFDFCNNFCKLDYHAADAFARNIG